MAMRLAKNQERAFDPLVTSCAFLVRHFFAPVAQLDRASPREGEGYRSDSCRERHFASVAQLVEHRFP